MNSIIFSPHFDDEIIGCSEILDEIDEVWYFDWSDKTRIGEATTLCKDLSIKCSFTNTLDILNNNFKNCIIYAPEPFTESHPLHKAVGMIAYLLKYNNLCNNVIYYSTIMNQSWIHEVQYPESKQSLLNRYYNSQKSLWQLNYKYFLFEGRMEPL